VTKWTKFIIENKKIDRKNGSWRFLNPNEYHMKVKNIWIKSGKGDYNPEQEEKGYWQSVFDGFELGPQKWDTCRLCGRNLIELRKKNPQKTRFCSKDCKKVYHDIEIKRKEKGAEGIFWNTYEGKKPIFMEGLIASYKRDGINNLQIPLVAKKSKWRYKREKRLAEKLEREENIEYL